MWMQYGDRHPAAGRATFKNGRTVLNGKSVVVSDPLGYTATVDSCPSHVFGGNP